MPFDGVGFVPGPEPDELIVLRKARVHLADPGNWIKGRWIVPKSALQNANEAPVDGAATCAMGAVLMALKEIGRIDQGEYSCLATARHACPMYNNIHRLLRAHLPEKWQGGDVPTFNDSTNTAHGQILALFDAAIQTVEETLRERALAAVT